MRAREYHGATKTAEYRIWRRMMDRCENTNASDYRHYGGRGIKVCQQWRGAFAAFLSDMGPRPSQGHTLERTNNSRGYEPGNCKWATRSEQSRNKRRQKNNTSGVTGIRWNAELGRWLAFISHKGKRIHLGVFANRAAALRARRAKAAEFGFNPDHGSAS